MHTRTAHPRRTHFWLGAALALVLSLVSATPALADDDKNNDNGNHGGKRIVVSPENMRGWGFAQETPNGRGRMEFGPGDPPAGRGSAELWVDSTGGEILAKAAYQGTPLHNFTRLEYWTYRTAPMVAIVQIALQFNIDRDLMDTDESYQGRLVYEPYYSHPIEAARSGVWLRWNTQDEAQPGSWWFTRAPQNLPVTGCSQADPCTWSEVLAKFPHIGVHRTLGAVILKAGGGWAPGFVGNTDALTIGCGGRTITWDFEPSQHDNDKDKKDKKNSQATCDHHDGHHDGHHDDGDDDEENDD